MELGDKIIQIIPMTLLRVCPVKIPCLHPCQSLPRFLGRLASLIVTFTQRI